MDIYRQLLVVLVILIYVKNADSIQTVKMQDYCETEISMILLSKYQLRITFSDDGTAWYDTRKYNCPVDIEAWYSWPKLMFYFENFNLSCSDGSMNFYDDRNAVNYVNGLGAVCGSKPKGVYTTDTRYLTIKYSLYNRNVKKNIFSIIVTSFAEDECPSYGYECLNGRCIVDDIQCNGLNSCGDNSGCRLSAGAIAGIVIGSLVGVTMIVSFIVALYCCRRKKTVHSPGQILSTNTSGQVLGSNQPLYNTNYISNPGMNYVGAQTGNSFNTLPSTQVQGVPEAGTSPYPPSQIGDQPMDPSAPPAYSDVCK